VINREISYLNIIEMRKNYPIFRTVLFCVFSVLLINCKKDSENAPIQTWDYSTFTDSRDGKIYKSIKIGNQEWMAENLAFKTADNSWNYGDSQELGTKYGRLYTWDAAIVAIPVGWHLPTDAEWKQLEVTLGMSLSVADGTDSRGTDEGRKLKATSGWYDNENKTTGNGTDEVGFAALPGGQRTNSGIYFVNGWYGYWWTASEGDNSRAWMRYVTYSNTQIYRNLSYMEDAYSVRCVKNTN
jgi:uncharacterized protein (TIGR02145 family)